MDNIAIRDRVGVDPDLATAFVRASLGGVSVDQYPTALQLDVLGQVARQVSPRPSRMPCSRAACPT